LIALPSALQEATALQDDRRHGQGNIFDLLGDGTSSSEASKPDGPRALPNVEPWPIKDQLLFEKEALGFYFSSHPLAQHEDELAFATQRLCDLERMPTGAEVFIGGMITGVRFTNAKHAYNGDTRMARFEFEDLTGSAECVMFPRDFSQHKDDVTNERVCFVKATVERTRDKPGLIINRILALEHGKRMNLRGLKLQFLNGTHTPELVNRVGQVLQRARGSCPVYVEIADELGKRANFKLSSEFLVDPDRLAISDLRMLLGDRQVQFLGPQSSNGGM
jgi:DNA polymerase-3 subunit alpha